MNFKEYAKLFCDIKGKSNKRTEKSEKSLNEWAARLDKVFHEIMEDGMTSIDAIRKIADRDDLSEFEKGVMHSTVQGLGAEQSELEDMMQSIMDNVMKTKNSK